MSSEVVGGARIYRPGTIAYHPPPVIAPIIVPWTDKLVSYADSIEIIGIISPTLIDRAVVAGQDPVSLTHTIFDTTTRADSARILLTNETGGTRYVTEVAIRGRLVTRLQGENGYLHDKFVDYDSISRDGEKLFELGNPFIVTLTQVNQLADWHWKRNRIKKHIYSISLIGFQSFFEPGEWYTLTIGSAGEEEYIDSVVECYSVRCSISSSGMGTQVNFREVEENWKFDSNEMARFIASGGFSRAPQGSIVTVAPQYYTGYADYYCGSSLNQVEINNAITAVKQSFGGGTIQLLNGIFNTTSSIVCQSDINLIGQGSNTVINAGANSQFDLISITGSALAHINNIKISAIKFIGESTTVSAGSAYYTINFNYCDNSFINECYINESVRGNLIFANSNGIVINNNIFDYNGLLGPVWAIVAHDSNFVISNNIIKNISRGGENLKCISLSGSSMTVAQNRIYNILAATGYTAMGIHINGSHHIIANNVVESVKQKSNNQYGYGIYVDSLSTSTTIISNYTYNNGLATSLQNISNCNFYDIGTDTQLG